MLESLTIVASFIQFHEEAPITRSLIFGNEAHLLAAIAQAGTSPRVLDLWLRGERVLLPHVSPLLAGLTRVATLRLELPLLLEDALTPVGGCCASLRELNLSCTRYSSVRGAETAAQLALYLSRAPLPRSVTVLGFDVGDED